MSHEGFHLSPGGLRLSGAYLSAHRGLCGNVERRLPAPPVFLFLIAFVTAYPVLSSPSSLYTGMPAARKMARVPC